MAGCPGERTYRSHSIPRKQRSAVPARLGSGRLDAVEVVCGSAMLVPLAPEAPEQVLGWHQGSMALRSGEIRAETCTRGNGSRNGSVNQQADRRPAQVLGTHNSEDLRGPCRAAREADRARLERRRLQLYQV